MFLFQRDGAVDSVPRVQESGAGRRAAVQHQRLRLLRLRHQNLQETDTGPQSCGKVSLLFTGFFFIRGAYCGQNT